MERCKADVESAINALFWYKYFEKRTPQGPQSVISTNNTIQIILLPLNELPVPQP